MRGRKERGRERARGQESRRHSGEGGREQGTELDREGGKELIENVAQRLCWNLLSAHISFNLNGNPHSLGDTVVVWMLRQRQRQDLGPDLSARALCL